MPTVYVYERPKTEEILMMLRVVHLRQIVRSVIARRQQPQHIRLFSGGDEVEEEKEGPYNAETHRQKMSKSGKSSPSSYIIII